MKTIMFDCNSHNAPAYGCNRPGDNSGEYVPYEVAQNLYETMKDIITSYERYGSPLPLNQEVENALDALAMARGES